MYDTLFAGMIADEFTLNYVFRIAFQHALGALYFFRLTAISATLSDDY